MAAGLTPLGEKKKAETGFVGVKIRGKLINLVGEGKEIEVEGSKKGAPKTRVYAPATQEIWEFCLKNKLFRKIIADYEPTKKNDNKQLPSNP